MTIINAIVKLDPDTWCVTCVLTNPEATDGKLFETEDDAIAFMQALNLPYTTIRAYMYKGGNVRVEHIFHDVGSYNRTPFMDAFPEMFG